MAPLPHFIPDRRKPDTSVELNLSRQEPRSGNGKLRSLGMGLITGAADDDPSAIGTYAAVGAAFGTSVLWTAPVLLPMMATVVYLSAKLGQVGGEGIAGAVKRYYPRILWWLVAAVLIGNTAEAAADLGGVAASFRLLLPAPRLAVAAAAGTIILLLQWLGDYAWIRSAFRWLALALLAYIGAGILARPPVREVWRGTLLPAVHFDRNFLRLLVAVIGTSLSPYLYIWQASQEVEEDIAMGRRRLHDRQGTTRGELHHVARDIVAGMFFSNLVMYFIILATASTLYPAGIRHIGNAAEAAEALAPLSGSAARFLFAAGVVGVGFLAIPVMTVGAGYCVCEAMGWRHGLSLTPREGKEFYAVITGVTLMAVGINALRINPMQALVWAGVAQGILAPGLLALIMIITGNRRIMGRWTNTPGVNWLGWITTGAVAAAVAALGLTLLRR